MIVLLLAYTHDVGNTEAVWMAAGFETLLEVFIVSMLIGLMPV